MHGNPYIMISGMLNNVTFLRRMDGSVDFARTWAEYRAGFGNTDGEMWLGLEEIHQLSTTYTVGLRVEMSDFDDVKYWTEYSRFTVGPESDCYRVDIRGYDVTSTAGDGTAYGAGTRHTGECFTTIDQDNDSNQNGKLLLVLA